MFEWDEAKSEANLKERGFDFAYAALVFDGPTLEFDDNRADYGERRIQAIGRVGPDVLFVVYTWRDKSGRDKSGRDKSGRDKSGGGEIRRIVSARLANRKERDIHEKTFFETGPQ